MTTSPVIGPTAETEMEALVSAILTAGPDLKQSFISNIIFFHVNFEQHYYKNDLHNETSLTEHFQNLRRRDLSNWLEWVQESTGRLLRYHSSPTNILAKPQWDLVVSKAPTALKWEAVWLLWSAFKVAGGEVNLEQVDHNHKISSFTSFEKEKILCIMLEVDAKENRFGIFDVLGVHYLLKDFSLVGYKDEVGTQYLSEWKSKIGKALGIGKDYDPKVSKSPSEF